MANLLDYIDWRGDIPVHFDGFGEVDNLILAELSFVRLSGIVPGTGEDGSVTLRDAAKECFLRWMDGEALSNAIAPDRIIELLRRAAASERFGTMRLSGYEEIFSEEHEQQFAALTFEVGDGTVYCAFRGTDDTLIGWKEDFNMGFMDAIPSQKSALQYLMRAAARYSGMRLRVGGHSKGGNLAVYSAANADEAVQSRILRIYNNDGPGFNRDLSKDTGYRRIESRILSVMPQSSVVGKIMEHEENATIVRSTASGIGQHNGFTWQVRGRHFEHLEDFSREGKRTEETLESWAAELSPEQREAFVGALYEVLSGTGARTLGELSEDKLQSAAAMLKTYRNLDDQTRTALSGAMGLLLRLNAKSVLNDVQEAGGRELDGLRHRLESLWRRFGGWDSEKE